MQWLRRATAALLVAEPEPEAAPLAAAAAAAAAVQEPSGLQVGSAKPAISHKGTGHKGTGNLPASNQALDFGKVPEQRPSRVFDRPPRSSLQSGTCQPAAEGSEGVPFNFAIEQSEHKRDRECTRAASVEHRVKRQNVVHGVPK